MIDGQRKIEKEGEGGIKGEVEVVEVRVVGVRAVGVVGVGVVGVGA